MTNSANNSSFEGKLLVATPSLNGSIFEKALIFICAHDETGAVGVVINKSVGSITTDELIQLLDLKRNKKSIKEFKILYGGPVEETKLFILSADKTQKDTFSTDPKLTLFTNAEGFLADVLKGTQKDDFILVKGFCGWDKNQLEEEIKENSWMLLNPDYSMVFPKKKLAAWDKIIKSIGIKKPNNIVSYSGSA